MDVSIVIPLYNEDESLVELESWIKKVVSEHGISYEIIFIDDGSNDNSWSVIENLSAANNNVVGIKFRRNYGKSAALHTGFQAAKGDVVITMDADLQDSPDEIPGLIKMIKEDGFDLVSGWKKRRHDPISKTLPSKLFNKVTQILSGIKLHDFNCGLKAYKLQLIKSIEVYGEMHRYIPLLAKWAGFKNIGEKVVQHQARKFGITKFGAERYIKGFLDLLSVLFVGKFGKRPMHFMGSLGSIFFIIGFLILFFLSYQKIVDQVYKIHERPIFYFGILSIIIGTQLFATGFLAELISRNSTNRNQYLVDKEIGRKE